VNILEIDSGTPIVLSGGGPALNNFGMDAGNFNPNYSVAFAADTERSANQVPPVILDNIKWEILA
jgi:hypothetical protein